MGAFEKHKVDQVDTTRGAVGMHHFATLAEGESHEGTSLGNDVVGIKSV